MRKLLPTSLIRFACFAIMVTLVGCSSKSTDDDVVSDDLIPPAAVSDLRITDVAPTSLTLKWTAPGDDDTSGWVESYDLRGALETITEANFAAAVKVDIEILPLMAGTTQEVTINELDPSTTYYFALKSSDELGNVSGISNCAHATCPQEQVIEIPDPVLQQLIRAAVARPSGDIRLSDMLKLIDIGGNDMGIATISGLEYATNLKIANLLGNQITDLTPLSNLTQLEALNITANGLTDISDISGLTNLVQLGIGQNQLTDISVVANMPRMRSLAIHDNPQLSHLSPIDDLDSLTDINLGSLGLTNLDVVAGKKSLWLLIAGGNNLSDISALADLPALRSVYLAYSQVTDLAPLVANASFATGAELDVRGNPLSQVATDEQIPALQARGVTVTF